MSSVDVSGFDGRVWRLTMLGWLGPWHGAADGNAFPSSIHGQIGATPVTLLDVMGGGWSAQSNDPPYESQVFVNTIICGLHVTNDTKFTTAGVRLLNLNEWADRPPWRFKPSFDNAEQPTILYNYPKDLNADLPGARVTLWRGSGHRHSRLSSLILTSDEWVYFDFKGPLVLDTILHTYIRPLKSLIELAAAQPSAILELTVMPEEASKATRAATILTKIAQGETPPPRPEFQFLFTLRDIDFRDVVPAWWNLQSEIGMVSDIIATLSGGGFVGSHFFNAASSIECYHRRRNESSSASTEHKERIRRIVSAAPAEDSAWLKQRLAFTHEPSFAQRIDAVVNKAGPHFAAAVGNPIAWRNWVRDGRNAVAHRGPSMVDVDKEWTTTVCIASSIKWLITLVLLKDLGVPDAVISDGVQREGGLRAASRRLQEIRPDWFT